MTYASLANPWLAWPKPNPRAGLRLFCIPYAGGGAQIYHNWPDVLPDTIEVCSVKLPGRGARFSEKPFHQMAPLVQELALALLPFLNKPFAFFGHSMGALVGFELIRQLRKDSLPEPFHLFVSGCYAPPIPDPNPICHLPDEEFLGEMLRLEGVPQDVLDNRDLIQLMLPTLRADFTLTETYVYSPEGRLTCPITAFGGLRDPLVRQDDLEAWRHETDAKFTMHMFPGNHFFLHAWRLPMLQRITLDIQQRMGLQTA